MGQSFYLLSFDLLEDRWKALLHGPCIVAGFFLSLRLWEPRFSPSSASRDLFSPVWLRLPELPLEYYHRDILPNIGDALGTFLGVDEATHNIAKINFARICILRNLCEPLPSSICLDGIDQTLVFEGALGFCTKCNNTNHTINTCPIKSMPRSQTASRPRLHQIRSRSPPSKAPNSNSLTVYPHKDKDKISLPNNMPPRDPKINGKPPYPLKRSFGQSSGSKSPTLSASTSSQISLGPTQIPIDADLPPSPTFSPKGKDKFVQPDNLPPQDPKPLQRPHYPQKRQQGLSSGSKSPTFLPSTSSHRIALGPTTNQIEPDLPSSSLDDQAPSHLATNLSSLLTPIRDINPENPNPHLVNSSSAASTEKTIVISSSIAEDQSSCKSMLFALKLNPEIPMAEATSYPTLVLDISSFKQSISKTINTNHTFNLLLKNPTQSRLSSQLHIPIIFRSNR